MNSISKKEFYESITHKDKDIIIEGWEKIFSQMKEDEVRIEDHSHMGFGFVVKSRFGIQIVDEGRNEFECIQQRIDLWNKFFLTDKPSSSEIQRILWWMEKPFRPDCLLEILKKDSSHLTDEEVWELVTDTWSETEFNSGIREIWLELFSLRKPIPSLKEELPEEMTVWRGGHCEGFSWTLSREIGEWFVERFGEETPLLSMKVKKSDVLFYTNDRHEEEVVLLPKNRLFYEH